MKQLFVKEVDLIDVLQKRGFSVGYQNVVANAIDSNLYTILYSNNGCIVKLLSTKGFIETIGVFRNTTVFGNTTIQLRGKTGYSAMEDLQASLEGIEYDCFGVASVLSVFEDVFFEKSKSKAEKIEGFLKNYHLMSTGMQELFRSEFKKYNGLREPSADFDSPQLYDCFMNESTGKAFYVSACTDHCCILNPFPRNTVGEARQINADELIHENYIKMTQFQVISAYSDIVQGFLNAIGYVFEPKWAAQCHGIKIPDTPFRHNPCFVFKEITQCLDLSGSSYGIKCGENCYIHIVVEPMLSYISIEENMDLDTNHNCYNELRDTLENSDVEAVISILGNFILRCCPILYHLEKLDRFLEVNNAYMKAERVESKPDISTTIDDTKLTVKASAFTGSEKESVNDMFSVGHWYEVRGTSSGTRDLVVQELGAAAPIKIPRGTLMCNMLYEDDLTAYKPYEPDVWEPYTDSTLRCVAIAPLKFTGSMQEHKSSTGRFSERLKSKLFDEE